MRRPGPRATPLYAQLQAWLLRRIREEWRPGTLLPTQQRLAQETGASLITVKRAVAELVREGWLDSVPGRGMTVRSRPVTDAHTGVSSWTDTIAGLGQTPRTGWVRLTVRIPPAEVRHRLGLKARERSVLVERLRLVDDDPLCLMSNELPLALVPDLPRLGLGEESLYVCLRKRYGLVPGEAEEEVWARGATREERAVFRPRHPLVLVVERFTVLEGGGPLELAQVVAPAEKYRYRVRLLGAGPAGGAGRSAAPSAGTLGGRRRRRAQEAPPGS